MASSEKKPKKKDRYEVRLLKGAVFVNGLVPLVLLAWDAARDRLGANPIEFVLRTTGTMTLVFLVLTLAVTPVKRWLHVPILARVRRMLGLFAFFYGTLHFATYVVLDKFLSLKGIVEDVLGRYFITIGMIAYFAMIYLAWTSTDAQIKKLGGPRWREIHKRIYWIAPLGVLHYWMLVKADLTKPIVFAVLVGGLLLARLVHAYKPVGAKPDAE